MHIHVLSKQEKKVEQTTFDKCMQCEFIIWHVKTRLNPYVTYISPFVTKISNFLMQIVYKCITCKNSLSLVTATFECIVQAFKGCYKKGEFFLHPIYNHQSKCV